MVAEKHVDARGLACPQPVVLTRKAMLEQDVNLVRVVVDREVPSENIQRLARTQGWQPEVDRQGEEIHLTLTRGPGQVAPASPQPEPAPASETATPQVVVFVTSNLFGVGDEKLGQILMKAFIKNLKELDTQPQRIIFANSGVRLTTQGSDLIDELRKLEQKGVVIASCGTCLDYYQLTDSLRVGVASNMYEIATALVEADRVVQP
jgi:selenium metabolism protein YedF